MTDSSKKPASPPDRLSRLEILIQWLLRLSGAVVMLAIVPVFFPAHWMQQIHDRTGLGAFPDHPISWYLARSLSLMYFAHGVMIVAISCDVRKFWTLIKIMCLLNVLIGAVLLGIDLNAPMPWWWTLTEGPGIMAGGILLFMLVRKQDAKP